jgi:cytochrome b561
MNREKNQAIWRFARTARLLHWIVAASIFFLLGLGWYMMAVEREPGAKALFDLHKSIGLTVFALIAIRLVWRLGHPPQALPATVPQWQKLLANVTEWSLYVCMIAMPLTGYLGAAHQKQPPRFFGLATPAWAIPNHDVAEQFFGIHSVIAWILSALIALHLAGALKHILIDKDTVFQRMSLGSGKTANR